jgi:hypothetical protein
MTHLPRRPSASAPEVLYTLADVARLDRCSVRTLRRAIDAGLLEVIRIGPAGRLIRVTPQAHAAYRQAPIGVVLMTCFVIPVSNLAGVGRRVGRQPRFDPDRANTRFAAPVHSCRPETTQAQRGLPDDRLHPHLLRARPPARGLADLGRLPPPPRAGGGAQPHPPAGPGLRPAPRGPCPEPALGPPARRPGLAAAHGSPALLQPLSGSRRSAGPPS